MASATAIALTFGVETARFIVAGKVPFVELLRLFPGDIRAPLDIMSGDCKDVESRGPCVRTLFGLKVFSTPISFAILFVAAGQIWKLWQHRLNRFTTLS